VIFKIDLITVAVGRVDRAKAIDVHLVGVAQDHQVDDCHRFMQLTPPWLAVLRAPGNRDEPGRVVAGHRHGTR
jgi:hypothetical protein